MTLIQSYVRDKYFVSTILRTGSDMYNTKYYETMSFDWDYDTKKVGKVLSQGGSIIKENALKTHFTVCGELLKK